MSHLSWFANRLNQQRHDGEFCDVLLEVAGRTLPTHSCVLSACSPYFRQLIVSNRPHPQHLLTSGGSFQQIVLDVPWLLLDDVPDGVPEAVSDLLDFVYTGRIELKESNGDLVVRLAETLALEGLTELIRSRYNRGISGGPVVVARADGEMVLDSETGQGKTSRKRQLKTSNLKTSLHAYPSEPDARRATPQSKSDRPVRIGHKRRTPVTHLTQHQPSDNAPFAQPPTHPTSDTCTRVLRSRRPAPPIHEATKLLNDVPEDPPAVFPPPTSCNPKKKYKFSCYQCKFVSRHLAAIRAHKLVHPGRTYECLACSYITGRWPKLLEHLLDAEHGDTTRCSLCEHEAIDPASLRVHLRRHGDVPARPFFCDFCDVRFDCRSSLTAHVTKHSSNRPFVCSVCHRAFKQKGPLQAHMVTHADVKGFLCEQCGFRTAYKYHLRMHERTHNGSFLRCSYLGCTYQTIYEPSLQTHSATHTKVKPYQCEVCGQSFALKQSLGRHSKLHNAAANLLRCPRCPYTSTRRDKLRDHNRKSHGGAPDQQPDIT